MAVLEFHPMIPLTLYKIPQAFFKPVPGVEPVVWVQRITDAKIPEIPDPVSQGFHDLETIPVPRTNVLLLKTFVLCPLPYRLSQFQ